MSRIKAISWVYKPSLDLLIGCGAWSVPLLLLAYPFRGSPTLAVSGAFYALALLVNYPHYMATIYRAYHTREDLYKYRIFTIHITGLLLATIVLAQIFPRMLPWLYTIYLTWSPWHYMGQNFGLAMMFTRRNGVQPAQRDRNLLYAAFVISYAMVFLSIHTRPSGDPYVMSLALPWMAGRILRMILAPVFLGAGIWAFIAMARMRNGKDRVGWRVLFPAFVLFSTEFLWFVLPSLLEVGFGFRIPSQRYADGVLALMHSAQYLWITSYYARREAQTESGASPWNVRAYFGVLVIGGIALFVPGPWLFSRIAGLDFTASFLTFTALVNIHHFILDGAVWKLRDGRIASLLGARAKPAAATSAVAPGASESAAPTRGKLGVLLDWLRGTSDSARFARRAFVIALVLLALIDQAKYLLSLRPTIPSLTRASELNPNDSSVWMNLAQVEAAAGNQQETLAALRKAVAVNPHRVEAQQALAMYYVQNKLYDLAAARYQEMSRYFPLDARSWLNYGLLEWQAQHIDTAMLYWHNAEALDPNNKDVHLYLAGGYDEKSRPVDAIRYYLRYIVLLGEEKGVNGIDRRSLALTSLKLGSDYMITGDAAQARYWDEKAALLAQQIPDSIVESLARMRLAEALVQLNRRSDALRNYQAALALDKAAKDDPTIGADWSIYAQFLQAIDAPRPLVLAAYLRSEELLGEKADTKAREKLEAEMGSEAKRVREDLKEMLRQAMTYKLF